MQKYQKNFIALIVTYSAGAILYLTLFYSNMKKTNTKYNSVQYNIYHRVKFYISTIIAFVYLCVLPQHLVQLPTFGHREHFIASILTLPNQTLTYIDKCIR